MGCWVWLSMLRGVGMGGLRADRGCVDCLLALVRVASSQACTCCQLAQRSIRVLPPPLMPA